MILKSPHLCTKLEIWSPRYHDSVVLLSQNKVHHASSVILIEFTKAKSLIGQRFCVTRDVVQSCPLETNGKIPCYCVKMSLLESWESGQEIAETANKIFPD